jgi:hypothetical protein
MFMHPSMHNREGRIEPKKRMKQTEIDRQHKEDARKLIA